MQKQSLTMELVEMLHLIVDYNTIIKERGMIVWNLE